MDYDFSLDERLLPRAQFSMEAAAFGPWLSDECNTLEKTERLLTALTDITAGLTHHHVQIGCEQRLVVDAGEVTVSALSLDHDADYDDQLPDDALNLYDEELMSGCGLDDFKACVQAWRDYLSEQRR